MELLDIDEKATRKRVDKFFKETVLYYLLRSGYTYDDLIAGIPEKPMCEARLIYEALNACKPIYKELLEKYYLKEEKMYQIGKELNINHNSLATYRTKAVNQFASNLVALQEFHNIKPVLDLRVME